MCQFQTYVLAKIAARCQPESVVRTADDRAICTRSVTHSDENGAALSLAIAKTLGIFGGISCHCKIGGARRAQALDQ